MILVGPSGCGKSTALRMIAGLEDITDGDLVIGGERVNDLAPRDRDIAMVFQNYALYPHMTVRDNMGFALKLAKDDQGGHRPARQRGREDPRPRAAPGAQAGEPVRRPAPARGDGPRDRALAEGVPDGRAAVEPRREAARADAHRGGADPAAARDDDGLRDARPDRGDDARRPRGGHARRHHPAGRRRPKELYEQPANLFVAGFIGSPSMNFVPAHAGGRHDQAPVRRGAAPGLDQDAHEGRRGPGRARGDRGRAARALRGRAGRARPARAAVQGAGRRRRVDGLRALRLLRRQVGRTSSPPSSSSSPRTRAWRTCPATAATSSRSSPASPRPRRPPRAGSEMVLDTSQIQLFDPSNGPEPGARD